MADTDVSPQDVLEAASFMQQYLLSKIPDGDFTRGGGLYDHAIQGFAYLFAYLRKQIGIVRARQSLLTLATLPPEESVDDAANAILANLFVNRVQGKFSKAPAIAHLSERVDVLILPTTRFFKTRSTAYLIDSDTAIFFPATELRAVIGSDGRTSEWVTPPFQLVAARTGREFDQPAGPFVSFNRFSPQATLVENTTAFVGGDDVQSTTDFISNANVAIALRALLNARSNAAVIKRLFTSVEDVVTVGAGSPEMTRDLVTDLSPGFALHLGGHMDIYLRSPVQQTVEQLVVGDSYPRADNRVLSLYSPIGGVNFVTGSGINAAVKPGDVIVVSDGLPEAPFQFRVLLVETDRLTISTRIPFSRATEEDAVTPVITFSVGNNYPAFDNKVSSTSNAATVTSRSISRSGAVFLQGGPVYRVKKVELLPPLPVGLSSYADPETGSLIFTRRVNALLPVVPTPGDALPFALNVERPSEGQSGKAVVSVSIGWPGVSFDGQTVEVTYDALSGFSQVDTFVNDALNRPGAASTLVKGLHPIYVYASIPYKLVAPDTADLTATNENFDEGATSDSLVDYVNRYRSASPLDQGRLATKARELAGTELTVYPFSIQYELYGADGLLYRYETQDTITLFPDGSTTAVLVNPTEVGLPSTGYQNALKKRLYSLSVSDKVSRYISSPGSMTFVRRI